MTQAASHAKSAKRASSHSSLSQTSFGLINMPLGAAVVPLTSRAKTLTSSLAEIATDIADNVRVLGERWQEVEDHAEEIAAKLADAMDEVDPR